MNGATCLNPLYCTCCRQVRSAGDYAYRRGVRAHFCAECLATYGYPVCQHKAERAATWRKPKLDMSILDK